MTNPIGEASSERFHERHFGDGSGLGCLAPPGADPRTARLNVNERLQASRARKIRMGDRCQRQYPCVVKAPDSKALMYWKAPYEGFLRIDGDEGRAHYPQAWASGFLPLIPNQRLSRFTETPVDDLLRVDFSECSRYDLRQVSVVYLTLLHLGWREGIIPAASRAQDLSLILNNMGVPVDTSFVQWNVMKDATRHFRECLTSASMANRHFLYFWQILTPWLKVKATPLEIMEPYWNSQKDLGLFSD